MMVSIAITSERVALGLVCVRMFESDRVAIGLAFDGYYQLKMHSHASLYLILRLTLNYRQYFRMPYMHASGHPACAAQTSPKHATRSSTRLRHRRRTSACVRSPPGPGRLIGKPCHGFRPRLPRVGSDVLMPCAACDRALASSPPPPPPLAVLSNIEVCWRRRRRRLTHATLTHTRCDSQHAISATVQRWCGVMRPPRECTMMCILVCYKCARGLPFIFS